MIKNIVTTDYDVFSKRLPTEFDGFKIALLSDTHSDYSPEINQITTDGKPDIVVFAGDMCHDDGRSCEPVKKGIAELCKKLPVYMVSGNHDVRLASLEEDISFYRALGVIWLENEAVTLERNGAKIRLAGLADPKATKPVDANRIISEYISQLPPIDGYSILLFHRANKFDNVKDLGYDLIISGHMHGGQFRLPFIGGVLAPKSSLFENKGMIFFPKYTSGIYTHKGTQMIVGRGLGNAIGLIPRINNKPEIVFITLKKL